MFKLLLLVTCTIAMTACAYVAVNGFPNPSPNQRAMSSAAVSIKSARLIAREQPLAPIGSDSRQNYPTKSATVFVELENLERTEVRVMVQKIEVRNQASDRVELIHQTPQEIVLKPLQVSIRDFHLTQPGTFEDAGQVKAIVTLNINNQPQVIESAASEIQPY